MMPAEEVVRMVQDVEDPERVIREDRAAVLEEAAKVAQRYRMYETNRDRYGTAFNIEQEIRQMAKEVK